MFENNITDLADARPRVNLGESFGPLLNVGAICAAQDLADVPLGYQTSWGDDELRGLIAARGDVGPEQVLVTPGAAAAHFLIGLTQGEGDVVVCRPCFPPLMDSLRLLGRRVVPVATRFDSRYAIDVDRVIAALSKRTTMVSISSPQNPSGVAVARRDLDLVLDAMEKICPRAVMCVDETYREATFDQAVPRASYATRSPRVVVCSSLSKAFGAAGLRIGWVAATDRKLIDRLRMARFNLMISCGAVDERLATSILHAADDILRSRSVRMSVALRQFTAWAESHQDLVDVVTPDAGSFCVVRLRIDGPRLERWHAWLTRERVLVARGAWFGDGANTVRIGFGFEPPDRTDVGLQVMSDALAGTARVTGCTR